jgi:hypothetical protein
MDQPSWNLLLERVSDDQIISLFAGLAVSKSDFQTGKCVKFIKTPGIISQRVRTASAEASEYYESINDWLFIV